MREAIITSPVLIMCIVLLRQLCKRRISAKMQYMLWLVVAVRLVMPGITAVWPNLMPESDYSIWHLGMILVCVWMAAVNVRFMHRLHGSRRIYETEDFKLPVYTAKELPSPCLYGLPWKLAVYLPEDVSGDEERVRHILAHEYCHFKHKDVFGPFFTVFC